MYLRPVSGAATTLICTAVLAACGSSQQKSTQHVVQPPTAGLVNPLGSGNFYAAARINTGVDVVPLQAGPVGAIADGTITYSSTTNPGWPGGAFIAERIDSGKFKGKIFYAAMHLRRLLKVGSKVQAGQTIAHALPGFPWLQLGWGAQPGTTAQPLTMYSGTAGAEGTPTTGGKAMARLLRVLGAPTQTVGPGPLYPGLK